MPGALPASAGDAPTGIWKTTHGIAAAINKTAECVAKRGAAYFRDSPPFPFLIDGLAVAYTRQTALGNAGLHRRDYLTHVRHAAVTVAP